MELIKKLLIGYALFHLCNGHLEGKGILPQIIKTIINCLKGKARLFFIHMFGELGSFWKNYIFQCFLATLTMLLLLLLLSMENIVVIASIGSTAFIVFAMPKSITAQPRKVIGGHMMGILSGSLCASISHPSFTLSIILYSFAVGLSIFLMTITDTEHPPASGTALGIAITGVSLSIIISIVVSVITLSLAHRIFKPFLKDLV